MTNHIAGLLFFRKRCTYLNPFSAILPHIPGRSLLLERVLLLSIFTSQLMPDIAYLRLMITDCQTSSYGLLGKRSSHHPTWFSIYQYCPTPTFGKALTIALYYCFKIVCYKRLFALAYYCITQLVICLVLQDLAICRHILRNFNRFPKDQLIEHALILFNVTAN